MLVLTRSPLESVMVEVDGEIMEIKFLGRRKGESINLGFNAPKHFIITRKEFFGDIRQEQEKNFMNKLKKGN